MKMVILARKLRSAGFGLKTGKFGKQMGTNPGSSNGDIELAEDECCIIRKELCVLMLRIFKIVYISCERYLRPCIRIQNTCFFHYHYQYCIVTWGSIPRFPDIMTQYLLTIHTDRVQSLLLTVVSVVVNQNPTACYRNTGIASVIGYGPSHVLAVWAGPAFRHNHMKRSAHGMQIRETTIEILSKTSRTLSSP